MQNEPLLERRRFNWRFKRAKSKIYPLLIPELRYCNTFYHTLYGRILSVRFVLPFIVRSPCSKNPNKSMEVFSRLFARQSKWGACIVGEGRIEKFNEEFNHFFCTGSERQNTLKTVATSSFRNTASIPICKIAVPLFYQTVYIKNLMISKRKKERKKERNPLQRG